MHLTELIDKNSIAVIDLETTGLDCMRDCIIDVGAVKIGGWMKEKGPDGKDMLAKANIVGQYSSLVSCPVTLPGGIAELTGISDAGLKGAPPIDTVLKELKMFIGDSIVVGHNIAFDCGFLCAYGKRCGIDFNNRKLDTMAIAKAVYRDKIRSYSLSALAELFGIQYRPHRALNDALAAAQLFCELAQRDDESHCNY